MPEFTEQYKSLSNSELLKILADAKSYQSLAVETAKKEIESRQLSKEELKQAQTEIEFQLQLKQQEIEKRKQQGDKIKTNITTFFDTISPLQNGIQTPEKIIRLTIIIFGSLTLYRIYTEFGMLRVVFYDGIREWDLSILEYFFSLIILPLATFLFWKRKNIGWILLSIFLTYSAVNTIGLFVMNLGRQPSGIPALESIFPTISPITYLMSTVFFGGTLWIISKENIRSVYQVTKRSVFLTIGLTIVANAVFIFSVIA